MARKVKEGEEPKVSAYEKSRQLQIEKNRKRMLDLGLEKAAAVIAASSAKPPTKRVKRSDAPRKPALPRPTEVRRSSRARRDINYSEDAVQSAAGDAAWTPPVSSIVAAAPAVYDPPDAAAVAIVASYEPSDGARDELGRLRFDDHPEFTPSLTPKQVIQAGSWGGCYFNPRGGRPGIYGPSVDVTHEEFPADWFEGLADDQYRGRRYEIPRNKYRHTLLQSAEVLQVNAGQNQAAWETSGWIRRELDPRGWFQWYCRFYQGRRTNDDDRQIGRWKGVAGERGRWKRALVNKIVKANKRFDDGAVSPVIRQTLLHWAHELTEAEFNAVKAAL